MGSVAEHSPANPFSPSFGTTPPLLAGRDEVMARFAEAIEAGPTHPDYTLLVTGDRGTGKTALLNALEAMVSERGWMTVTAAASSEPLSERIASEAIRCLERLQGGVRQVRLGSVTVLGVGLELDHDDAAPARSRSLTSVLEQLGEALTDEGTGLLLTVDELHDVPRDDVRNVASAVQIVTRRRQNPIAFAAAALPLIEHSHLADPHMTFLQRCARAPLGPLTPDETRRALREPIVSRGSAIDDDALAEAVDSTLWLPVHDPARRIPCLADASDNRRAHQRCRHPGRDSGKPNTRWWSKSPARSGTGSRPWIGAFWWRCSKTRPNHRWLTSPPDWTDPSSTRGPTGAACSQQVR